MSTNYLLIFVLVITVVLSVFLPNIIEGTDFNVGNELPEEPSVWDVLTFNAAWIWACMTFDIPDMPEVMGVVFWVVSFIWVYCIYRLVRGTS